MRAQRKARRPRSVSVVVVLCYIGALLQAGMGILLITFLDELPKEATSVAAATGVFMILVSLGMFGVGYFVWIGRNWARITLSVLLAAGCCIAVADMIAAGKIGPSLLDALIYLALIVALNGEGSKEYFRTARSGRTRR